MFVKATKTVTRLRAALFGPSGSGKTFTALQIASGIGGPIAVIDSEHSSASKYADKFDFDTCSLDVKTVDSYIRTIEAAHGYRVLIIDSLTHAWKELLTEVDQIAARAGNNNTWAAWSKGTPKQNALIETILDFPGHVIVTMRSKTEWTIEKDHRGKDKPTRIGLAPEQGKGIEYEFDVLMEMNMEHACTVIKDRSQKFQDAFIEKPDAKFGAELGAWLDEGIPLPPPPPTREEVAQAIVETCDQLLTDLGKATFTVQIGPLSDLSSSALNNLLEAMPKLAGAWNAGRNSKTMAVLIDANEFNAGLLAPEQPEAAGSAEPVAPDESPAPTAAAPSTAPSRAADVPHNAPAMGSVLDALRAEEVATPIDTPEPEQPAPTPAPARRRVVTTPATGAA